MFISKDEVTCFLHDDMTLAEYKNTLNRVPECFVNIWVLKYIYIVPALGYKELLSPTTFDQQ